MNVARRFLAIARRVSTVGLLPGVAVVTAQIADAGSTHETGGAYDLAGHNADTHDNNPAHFSVLIRATHGSNGESDNGRVTSGGRFHDGCSDGCNGAFVSAFPDWAMDIDAPNTTAVNLYAGLEYWGWG